MCCYIVRIWDIKIRIIKAAPLRINPRPTDPKPGVVDLDPVCISLIPDPMFFNIREPESFSFLMDPDTIFFKVS
mgnify:CR=1 FL=1